MELKQQNELPFNELQELQFADSFIHCIQTFNLIGPDLLLGKLFDEIGFNKIEDALFKQLVITRLVYPVSKLKTVDYLFKYKGIERSVYSIYRYLDKLHQHQIEIIKQISLDHTLQGTSKNSIINGETKKWHDMNKIEIFFHTGYKAEKRTYLYRKYFL